MSLFLNFPGICQALQQSFRVRPRDLEVAEGGTAVIQCTVRNRAGRVQWTKDGLTLGKTLLIYFTMDFIGFQENLSCFPQCLLSFEGRKASCVWDNLLISCWGKLLIIFYFCVLGAKKSYCFSIQEGLEWNPITQSKDRNSPGQTHCNHSHKYVYFFL